MTTPVRILLLFVVLASAGCDERRATTASASASVAAPLSASAAPTLPRAPTQAAVDALVEEQRPGLVRACLADHHRGEGGVELQLIADVDGDGRVKDATVAGGGAALRPLRRCVSDASRGWSFPKSREGGTVTATVRLGPRSGD